MNSANVYRSVNIILFTFAVCLLFGPTCGLAQLYRSSVVGTDFDFITDEDPSAFERLESKGRHNREMPDKTGPTPLIQPAFVFVAYFKDQTQIDIAVDTDFGSNEAAEEEASRYVHRLGKLPTVLRKGVDRLVVHLGTENATAFSDVGLIVVYSDNATNRISTHDLEETIFHESIHAAWDKQHASSEAWLAAQKSDGQFVTDYAKRIPKGEDLAESALFAYTLIHHGDRIPEPDASKIRKIIPARIAFVEKLLPADKAIFYKVEKQDSADAEIAEAQEPDDANKAVANNNGIKGCTVDITQVGMLSDIASNALILGLKKDETKVSAFLTKAKQTCTSSDELRDAIAGEFDIDKQTLNEQIQKYLHCNCTHDLPHRDKSNDDKSNDDKSNDDKSNDK